MWDCINVVGNTLSAPAEQFVQSSGALLIVSEICEANSFVL